MAPLRALAALLGSRSSSPSSEELRRGGREVGYALVRRDAVVVETLRETIDDAEPDDDDDARDAFARGYRAALADTVSGFAAALDAWLEIEHAAEALGRREVQVLRALESEARPQVRIARELSMAAHDVSRAAKRLRAAGLVAAYPGPRDTEQLHRMTALGRAVVRELDARAVRADAAFAGGTPPTGETPMFTAEPAWSPAAPPPESGEAPVARARAASPSHREIHELDIARDRWTSPASSASDEDE